MTDLTEQWKNGELKKNKYWVKYKNGKIDSWELSEGITIESKPEIIEVLAPVPSYEEWQRVLHYAGKYEYEYTSCVMDYENLKQENQQLKELLKECRPYFDALVEKRLKLEYIPQVYKLLTKIDNAIGEK